MSTPPVNAAAGSNLPETLSLAGEDAAPADTFPSAYQKQAKLWIGKVICSANDKPPVEGDRVQEITLVVPSREGFIDAQYRITDALIDQSINGMVVKRIDFLSLTIQSTPLVLL